MAFSIGLLPDTDIVVVTGTGSGDLAESEAILTVLGHQTLVPRLTRLLFDVRALEYVPTADEARQIAHRYGTFGARLGCRMCYVAAPGTAFGIARMVEMLSEQEGVRTAAFTSLDDGVAWLRDTGP
jgi:hypothetical protein